jgi:hypothetical protein
MRSRWKAVLVAGASLALMAAAVPVMAGIPDVASSFYVPQTGTVATPTEGTVAIRNFRMCPNNDGLTNLPNNARIKVVVRDVNNNPIPNIAAADICVLFNGGTAAQGFSGTGADSVISNSTWNTSPLCPDLRCVAADAATDVNGSTYITFGGADVNNPGVFLRNSNRKWGHYDTTLPVYVLGFQLSGRITSASANGTYTLRIKSYDLTGGLGATANQGETVTSADYNLVSNNINGTGVGSYWRDFDSSGAVTSTDLNPVNTHFNHNCLMGAAQPPIPNP